MGARTRIAPEGYVRALISGSAPRCRRTAPSIYWPLSRHTQPVEKVVRHRCPQHRKYRSKEQTGECRRAPRALDEHLPSALSPVGVPPHGRLDSVAQLVKLGAVGETLHEPLDLYRECTGGVEDEPVAFVLGWGRGGGVTCRYLRVLVQGS